MEQTWVDTNTLCVEASGHDIQEQYPKYVDMFCPKIKLTAREAEKYFESAPKDVSVGALQGICRRFGALAIPCKALLEGIRSSAN